MNSCASIEHIVTHDETGLTLLELAERLTGAVGEEIVAHGGAWLAGRRVAESDWRVEAGATLSLRRPPAAGYSTIELSDTDIAYEDDCLIVLHKRSGWYVSATPWDIHGNVLAALGRYLAARGGIVPPLHLAHQLDRDTSGILLLTKDPRANGPLQAAFASGRVAKRYQGIVQGLPPAEGELRSGHGRAAGGRWRLYPLEEVGRELPDGGGRVRLAHTSYSVEQALAGAALVIAIPHTGRTHQIRLHMAGLGHPLLGDLRYGGPAHYAGIALQGHLLHAAELGLKHPLRDTGLDLNSPLPEVFRRVIR